MPSHFAKGIHVSMFRGYYNVKSDEYARYVRRREIVLSRYVSNIQKVIGRVDIGEGPSLLTKKYVWGRQCKADRYIIS